VLIDKKLVIVSRTVSLAKRAETSSTELQDEVATLERKNRELETELQKARQESVDYAAEVEAMEVRVSLFVQ